MTSNQTTFKETPLLNYSHEDIQKLITARGWRALSIYERIGAIYDFVRNEIKFGYNRQDDIPASEVLADGYGQCNTKGTLLMALLRAVNIPCRLHGFTIEKALQSGVVPPIVFPITPKNILHSWIEVYHKDKWINLEGFILDDTYLQALRAKFPDTSSICTWGAGTENLQNPKVTWTGTDTYIQKTGINQDFGTFNSPDEFYQAHSQDLGWIKTKLFQKLIRHWMNSRASWLRGQSSQLAQTRAR